MAARMCCALKAGRASERGEVGRVRRTNDIRGTLACAARRAAGSLPGQLITCRFQRISRTMPCRHTGGTSRCTGGPRYRYTRVAARRFRGKVLPITRWPLIARNRANTGCPIRGADLRHRPSLYRLSPLSGFDIWKLNAPYRSCFVSNICGRNPRKKNPRKLC